MGVGEDASDSVTITVPHTSKVFTTYPFIVATLPSVGAVQLPTTLVLSELSVWDIPFKNAALHTCCTVAQLSPGETNPVDVVRRNPLKTSPVAMS